MYTKMLVPLDGSREAESILPLVRSMAGCHGAAVVLLKVEEPPILLGVDEVIDLANYQQSRQRQRRETEIYLFGIDAKLRSEGIKTKIIVESGDVVKTILDVADRESADLITMASHGWGGLQASFYRSVATNLLKRIDRPLLICSCSEAA